LESSSWDRGRGIAPRLARKIARGLVICAALACQAPAQVAEHECRAAGTISLAVASDDSYSSATLTYKLADPKPFSTAWIEVWDRPKLLFQTQVPLKREGRIVWARKEGVADTPYELQLAVVDPELPIDQGDSFVPLGSSHDSDAGGVAFPGLLPQSLILEEGDSGSDVTLAGRDVGDHNRVQILEQEGPHSWVAREYRPASLVDLHHLRVRIPARYLSKPTVLQLVAMGLDHETFPIGSHSGGWSESEHATIYVTSKNRPLLSSIEPSELSIVDAESGVTIRVFGDGFTAESQVLTGPYVGKPDALTLESLFISPNHLQVTIPPDLWRSAMFRNEDHVLIWVRNGDNQHISDPKTLVLLPTTKFPVTIARQPSITSTSVYPIPLMDYRNPAFTLLKLYGENFRDVDVVLLDNGDLHDIKLKSRFVSPHEIHTWLPRELWRHHRLSFRLIARTSNGTCAAEVWDEE